MSFQNFTPYSLLLEIARMTRLGYNDSKDIGRARRPTAFRPSNAIALSNEYVGLSVSLSVRLHTWTVNEYHMHHIISGAILPGRQCHRHSQSQSPWTTSVRKQPTVRAAENTTQIWRALLRSPLLVWNSLPSSVQELTILQLLNINLKLYCSRYFTALAPSFN